MNTKSVHVIVRGEVQGVGFRWFVRTRARAHNVSGWVENMRDGSVELEAHGAAEDVDALIHALRTGPPRANVTEVLIRDLPATDPVTTPFDIRR